VVISLNLGTQIRKDVDLDTAEVQDELLYAIGLMVPIVKTRLDAHLEFFGGTPFANFGDRESTTMEGLAGMKFYFAKRWAVGLSGGMGFTRGVGSPDFRMVAMLGWVMPEKEESPPPPPPEKDSDGDGLLDAVDKCPNEPEDKDDFEDEDGCPDPDNDQDGVLDERDECVMEPEDKDGFEDENGCPDPDNDQDNIVDEKDECPIAAEDMDNFKDADGCPDPDNDQDTVLDVDDKCPLAPGKPEDNGCPKQVQLDVSTGQIKILDRVEFATGKDDILPQNNSILQEVLGIIKANDHIKRVRIEGHTDSRGKDKSNMDLSRRRALSVKRWLVDKGVSAARFDAFGCGENLPISDNKTKKGRQLNRRVEFHIIIPAPEEGVRDTGQACEIAE
jgi:large repetitive protein